MKPRARRWILWLLPFLVARAFVPSGFMLSASAGDLSWMFCPSVGTPAQLAALSPGASAHEPTQPGEHSHAGHHAQADATGSHGDEHANHFGASETGVCPFAVVATSCTGSDFYVANARFDSSSDLLPLYTVPADANRPIRADRIRGPPATLTFV
jgi:hypothetical protein